jgi:hypothetical protein
MNAKIAPRSDESPLLGAERIQQLIDRPEDQIKLSMNELYAIPLAVQQEIQLASVRKRFLEQVDRIPILGKLREQQSIDSINRLEDVAPLLLPHSAYKSYSLSLIEQGRFDKLTKWLNGLSIHDLGTLDASGIETIDDWIQMLDAKTPIRVIHSTGTSGKLSFLPRSEIEIESMVDGQRGTFNVFRDEPPRIAGPLEQTPLVFPWYRHGAMAYHRVIDGMVKYLYSGDETLVFALNPGRLSADAISLAGRLKAAEARGELGKQRIAPKLLARREAFLTEQKEAPLRMGRFLERLQTQIKGRSIHVLGSLPQQFDMAVAAKSAGITRLFHPVSHIAAGGGNKGRELPDDWEQTVKNFYGVQSLSAGYGMSEVVIGTRMCPNGKYHLPVFVIPFVLDQATGTPLPRQGTVTGRMGVFDVNARTYWGGFLTGDKVTVSWGDTPCACGRIGPYIHDPIRRFTEGEGGDDKITCAGAPDAHDKAIDFILNAAG